MSEELNRAKEIDDAVKAADAKKRADSDEASSKLDRLLEGMDSMNKRMDTWEAADKAKKDAEEVGPEGKQIEEKGDPKELKADEQPAQITGPDRFDSRADSAVVMDELAEIQTRADRACSAWSKSAVSPWSGEMPDAYRRRLAAGHQKHCDAWRDVDLRDLKGTALKNASQAIFADSIVASKNVEAIGRMNLREVRRVTDSGHVVKEYFGDPLAWMSQFAGGRSYAKFNLNGRRGED
jgi:hypothetical protein